MNDFQDQQPQKDMMNISIEFAEWLMQMLPPKYDGDTSRRFTPQIGSDDEKEITWIETHNFNPSNPKFYTTRELFERFINSNN